MMNKKIIEELMNTFPKKTEFKPREVIATAIKIGLTEKDAYKGLQEFPKIRRGVYDLSMVMGSTEKVSAPVTATAPVTAIKNVGVRSVTNDEVFVPQFDETFVAWGHFNDIVKIIKTKMFYPTYISGLSGNGKTFMVEQACAKANREYVRVQISPETDEDDLIGGFRLIDGETVFQKGPVIKAMEAGAILMIDEIDRGTNKIMCLQGVLEGKPVLIKKTGEVIAPAEGFNVLATANTKGKGSDDGRYSAATIIDEAFLERFTINIDQKFPGIAIEKKILMKHMKKFEVIDEEFSDLLVGWADAIRKTFYDEGIDEVVSTRRLCHIIQTFSIFGKRDKAIALCVNRFDDDTREAFIDLYEKVDATINNPEGVVSGYPESEESTEYLDALKDSSPV
jgi:hypothetical protein